MRRLAGLVLVVCLGWAVPAPADEPPEPGYSGVTPEGGEPPKPEPPPAGFQYITWPGFRTLKNGASEVFLQLTGPVTYKVKKHRGRIYVTLDRVKVHLKNSMRRVITKHFSDTPVAWFRLRKVRRKPDQLRLEIRLRRGSRHTVAMKRGTQYHYLVVSFPPPFTRSRATSR